MRVENINGGVDFGTMSVAGSKHSYDSSTGLRERKEKISTGRDDLESALSAMKPMTNPWEDFAESLSPFFTAMTEIIKNEGAQSGPNSWMFAPLKHDLSGNRTISGKIIDEDFVEIKVNESFRNGSVTYTLTRDANNELVAESNFMETCVLLPDPEPENHRFGAGSNSEVDRLGFSKVIKAMDIPATLPPIS